MVLGVFMPGGIDGADTYRRALEIRSGQRAIIMSGFAAPGVLQQARALGIGGQLRKPVSLPKLALVIRDELDWTG